MRETILYYTIICKLCDHVVVSQFAADTETDSSVDVWARKVPKIVQSFIDQGWGHHGRTKPSVYETLGFPILTCPECGEETNLGHTYTWSVADIMRRQREAGKEALKRAGVKLDSTT